jgi:hypothetical protein
MIWVDGYYTRRNGEYVWVGGHWTTPPRRGEQWVGDRWEHTEKGWRHIPGHWRKADK